MICAVAVFIRAQPIFALDQVTIAEPNHVIGLSVDALPVGLQVIGFRERDADLIGIARWISATLPQPDIVTSVPAAAAVGCGPDPYRT
jgi:Asp-tRNA(Asn)/Glu-tRNA(Gln) amidotransferase A subunit family amidase